MEYYVFFYVKFYFNGFQFLNWRVFIKNFSLYTNNLLRISQSVIYTFTGPDLRRIYFLNNFIVNLFMRHQFIIQFQPCLLKIMFN